MQLKLTSIIGLVGTCLCLVLVTTTPVMAQVTFAQHRSDYLFQIEKYAEAEREYSIDKASYQSLQTLASREKAVASTRTLLQHRAKVLLAYTNALESLLQDTNNIDLSHKAETLSFVVRVRGEINTYLNGVDSLVDVAGVNESSKQFQTTIVPLVFEAQYRVLSLRSIGSVQVIYDQYNQAANKFTTSYEQQVDSDNKKAVIERGLKDVEFHRAQAEASMLKSVLDYPEFLGPDSKDRPPDVQNYYRRTLDDLNNVLRSLKQSLRFLQELERQV